MEHFVKMDHINPFEMLARLGLTMTGIFSLVTFIDPQWLTIGFTAFAAIPTGLFYYAKWQKTNLEIKTMKRESEEAEEKKEAV